MADVDNTQEKVFDKVLKRKIVSVITVAVIILTALLVYFEQLGRNTRFHMQETAAQPLAKDLNAYVEKIRGMSRNVARYVHVTQRLSRNPHVSTDDAFNRDLSTSLESVKQVAESAIVYVMNPSGLVIASTVYGDNKSLTGNRYRFRPYFLDAMEGRSTIYAAVGVTTQERGLYFSSPVLVEDNLHPVGVVVIKMGLERFDQLLNAFITPAAVMSPDGIIFAANNNQWMYKTGLPISSQRLKILKDIKQFGDNDLEPLYLMLNEKTVDLNDSCFSIVKHPLTIPGWTLVTVEKISGTYPFGPALLSAFLAFLFTLSIVLNVINNRKKKIYAAQNKIHAQELLIQNEFLHTVLDSLAHPFYIIDLQSYKVVLANKASNFDRDSGFCYQFTHGRDIPCNGEDGHVCPMTVLKETGKAVIVEHIHQTAEGESRYHEIHAYPVFAKDGKLVQMVEYNLDITSRKRLESELIRRRQLESIGILAGGIAHDFNNILSVIIGNIDLVKDDLQPGEKHHTFLEHAERNALKAADLSRKLISFARGGWLERKKTTLPHLIHLAIDTLLLHGSLLYSTSFPDHLMPVYVDENQMEQVFLNLLMNASESKEDNGPLVEVSISACNLAVEDNQIIERMQPEIPNNSGYVKVSISDNGRGIPPEIMPKIFDPYFTTKNAVDKKGTGLGLSLCYSIIKKHGGLLNIQSEPGKGTVADVYLPAFTGAANLQKNLGTF